MYRRANADDDKCVEKFVGIVKKRFLCIKMLVKREFRLGLERKAHAERGKFCMEMFEMTVEYKTRVTSIGEYCKEEKLHGTIVVLWKS